MQQTDWHHKLRLRQRDIIISIPYFPGLPWYAIVIIIHTHQVVETFFRVIQLSFYIRFPVYFTFLRVRSASLGNRSIQWILNGVFRDVSRRIAKS